MIIVKYENEIRGKSPDTIYNLFLNMTPEKHIQMHPIHHKEWRVIKKSTQGVGTIIYGHEEYGGYRLRGKAHIIKAIYPKLIVYKQSRIVPILMIFYFKSIIGGTKLISILKIGFNNKYMCFIDWIIKKIFLTERFLLTHLQHVNEEFKNLESM
jgi:hypothetical protein